MADTFTDCDPCCPSEIAGCCENSQTYPAVLHATITAPGGSVCDGQIITLSWSPSLPAGTWPSVFGGPGWYGQKAVGSGTLSLLLQCALNAAFPNNTVWTMVAGTNNNCLVSAAQPIACQICVNPCPASLDLVFTPGSSTLCTDAACSPVAGNYLCACDGLNQFVTTIEVTP